MIVYHWTTREFANSILRTGLRENSFVCRTVNDWQGEVCLQIILPEPIDWKSREKPADWQAIVHERILPENILEIIILEFEGTIKVSKLVQV